jgi:hypothetical protein
MDVPIWLVLGRIKHGKMIMTSEVPLNGRLVCSIEKKGSRNST